MGSEALHENVNDALSLPWKLAGGLSIVLVAIAAYSLWPRATALELAETGRILGMTRSALTDWGRTPDASPVIPSWDMTFSEGRCMWIVSIVCVTFSESGYVDRYWIVR